MKKTEVGDPLLQFTLADQNGNLFSISSVIGKKNLVIYFYIFSSQAQATKHVDEAMRVLKGLK